MSYSKIILASGSPRRKELLALTGLNFDIVPSNFNEYLDHDRPVTEIVKELAMGKANDIAVKYPDAIVIGGDTLVTANGRQLGKPKNEKEAELMLADQCGKEVAIATGLAVVCKANNFNKCLAVTTRIKFKPYSARLVKEYLDTGDWKDKAGAWGVQSGAASLMESIDGSYEGLIGLPTKELLDILRELGIEGKAANLSPPIPTAKLS